jgi:CBS domain-containing protein
MKIGEICNRSVSTISKDASILEVAREMREHHIGDVIVTERSDGAVTLVTAPHNADLFETLRFMGIKGVRRIPVLDDDGGLYGILSVDDVLSVLTKELSFIAEISARQIERERSSRE